MRRRACAGLCLALAIVGLRTTASANHVAPPVVELRAGAYTPQEVHANREETVTWVARESTHTVTEDSCAVQGGACLFDFPGGSDTLDTGDTRTWTAPDADVTVGYYCRVHGRPTTIGFPARCGMCGRVTVGAGSPTPAPSPTPTPEPVEERFVPSVAYPSIQSAVNGAPRGTIVSVAPGVYKESVSVSTADITIRGTGDGVVVEGEGRVSTGIRGFADDLTVENVTVQNFTGNGVYWEGVYGFFADRVRSINNQPYGIYAHRSRRGRITNSYATGSGDAGFYIGDSLDADTLIEDVVAEGNKFGYSGTNSGGVVIRDSVFRNNSTGIAPNTIVVQDDAPQRGTHIYGNLIENNNRRDIPPAGFAQTLDYPAGIGVWIAGGWFNIVENNTITGHDRYGVLVSWLTSHTYANRIVDNVVQGAPGAKADLAWDGVGLNTCFAGNSRPDGEEPSFLPPWAPVLYDCGSTVQPGIPYPLPDVEILLYATRHHWCDNIGPEACALAE